MKYFVLKPKGTDLYAKASRRAMRAYAVGIRDENPSLAKELESWADSEQFSVLELNTSTEKAGQ